MPCQCHQVIFTVSATDLREWFLLSGVFYLYLLVSRPPWGREFNLDISRVLCWYFRSIPPVQIFVWIPTIHKRVIIGRSISALLPADHVKALSLFSDKLSMSKTWCHGSTQFAINLLIFIPLKLLANILSSAYDFAVNIVMLINITNNKTRNIHDLV